jgi:hypothetical protein
MGALNFRVPLGGLLAALIAVHALLTVVAVDMTHDLFGMSAQMHSAEVWNSPGAYPKLFFVNLILAPVTGFMTARSHTSLLQIDDWGVLVLNTLGTSFLFWSAVLVVRRFLAQNAAAG